MRPRAARNRMNRRKSCRRSYEMLTDCRFVSSKMQAEGAKEVAKYTKHPGQKNKFAEGQYRSRRGDAEAPRGVQAKRGAYPFLVEQSR